MVEDENGNIVRETMKDTDTLARYKTMHETLVYLSHLDHDDTESQMLEKLRLQVRVRTTHLKCPVMKGREGKVRSGHVTFCHTCTQSTSVQYHCAEDLPQYMLAALLPHLTPQHVVCLARWLFSLDFWLVSEQSRVGPGLGRGCV